MTDRPSSVEHPRAIRSFVLRAGRMGTGQQRALAELGPRFVLPYQATLLQPEAVFGRSAPVVLEIGFGMGDTTAEIAAARPEQDYLGVEVHTPGVGALLKQVEARGLTNVRVIEHDVQEVIDRQIPDEYLTGIHVFFPDPWPKARHNKRRLIQKHFVTKLSQKLRIGGYLHLATDWPDYADQMIAAVDAVAGRCEVWVDGGVRRGLDVAIALALGARGVLLGRPVLWALAAGGEAGVSRALAILREELELALALLGTPTPSAVNRAHTSP